MKDNYTLKEAADLLEVTKGAIRYQLKNLSADCVSKDTQGIIHISSCGIEDLKKRMCKPGKHYPDKERSYPDKDKIYPGKEPEKADPDQVKVVKDRIKEDPYPDKDRIKDLEEQNRMLQAELADQKAYTKSLSAENQKISQQLSDFTARLLDELSTAHRLADQAQQLEAMEKQTQLKLAEQSKTIEDLRVCLAEAKIKPAEDLRPAEAPAPQPIQDPDPDPLPKKKHGLFHRLFGRS